MHVNLTDDELMRLVCTGDERAFQYLYERHWYNLYSIAYRKLQRQDVAEELTQDIFLRLWQKRSELLISNLGGFLAVSLRNAIIDYIRSQQRETRYIDELQHILNSAYEQADESVNVDQLTERLEQALQQLPTKTRHVFELSRFEHLTTHEVAQRLSLSDKAIEYHLTKALRHLRTHLREFSLLVVWMMGNP